ncbi:MAG: hypothetical protein CVV64_04675 [Candidatus Wallbacteria bacterium HGW-Wallbacteria-1]|jgi:signal transduction histidine kinase|uniref:histidine kinase n=1 Tax=Candidatus Wallbacteria bacterium HGW-Wallbacteria-1 TaxID=2013854 RepID=A0A2N1PRV6_9BACT|nr:MAG: hypothetical protein CVV64_04675 [Candidatus Wallbacteria bacterium HGW-Wallbacteria-1]
MNLFACDIPEKSEELQMARDLPRCLVVDDEEVILRMLAKLFSKEYKVFTATSGAIAVEILRDNDIDVILTDLVMPEFSGTQLLRWAKSQVPWVEVIVMTGYGDVQTAVEAMKGGAFDFIMKPFKNLDEVKRIVGHACNRRRLALENDKLKEVNRLKDEFVTIIAHELRTPLTILNGYINIVKGSNDLEEDTREAIDIMGTASDRLSKLVEDIMLVMEAGYRTPHLENRLRDKINVKALIDQISSEIIVFIRKRGFDFSCQCPDDAIIHGRASSIRKVILNLLLNALKFTPDGGRIEISYREEQGEGIFRVSDNGIGIDLKDQGRLFQKFTVLHDPMHHSSGTFEFMTYGCGLGLAICRELVDGFNGRIWVRSEPDRGSDFFFSVPLTD